MMQATAFEYRHRYLLHGFIYTLCLAAPWHLPVWGFLQNGSTLFLCANYLARPGYQHFALSWNLILAVAALFALAGAALRIWGAAYLGATTVHRSGMQGDHIIVDGPYRYTRNPLYLGTILNTVAIAILMRPEAAALTLLLIVVLQYRLIAREEPFLKQHLGTPYEHYLQAVPRLLPTLRPRTAASRTRASWSQGILSELYFLVTAIAFATLGWSSGYSWETNLVRMVQGIVIALGVSVVARAFIPKAQF